MLSCLLWYSLQKDKDGKAEIRFAPAWLPQPGSGGTRFWSYCPSWHDSVQHGGVATAMPWINNVPASDGRRVAVGIGQHGGPIWGTSVLGDGQSYSSPEEGEEPA